MKRSIFIGFDAREAAAFAVARETVREFAPEIPVCGLSLDKLRACGLYTRLTSRRDGRLWDDISEAPMASEFAISRFLTPVIAGSGLALFMDADVMIRQPIAELFDSVDPTKAVSVVKHHFDPPEGVKMDNQAQTRYARKNWSSVCCFNADHPANRALTIDLVNTWPGRNLHGFGWLADEDIGALDPKWNWLAGHSDVSIDPAIVHFTDGYPSLPGYESAPYAEEWRARLARWVI